MIFKYCTEQLWCIGTQCFSSHETTAVAKCKWSLPLMPTCSTKILTFLTFYFLNRTKYVYNNQNKYCFTFIISD